MTSPALPAAGPTPPPAGDHPVESPPPRPAWLRVRYWILGMALVAGAVSASGTLDGRAQAATDRVFRQALLTYAAARGLDAAVSLAEGTQIAVEPAGVGVTVSAGEVLEPIDDLVEQFSSVMLVSATSLGIQSLLVRASAWWLLTTLLVAFLVARVGVAFFPERVHPRLRRIVTVGTWVLLLCRFAVPLYALGTTLIFERFLQPSQVEAVQAIEETSADVREIEQLDHEETDPGLVGRVSEWFSGAVERLDVRQRVEAFRDRVSQVTEHLMHLLVVFVLQTIVLPVAFLWALTKVLGALLRRAG